MGSGLGLVEQRRRLRAKVTHDLSIGHRRRPRCEPLLFRVRVRVRVRDRVKWSASGSVVRVSGQGLGLGLGKGWGKGWGERRVGRTCADEKASSYPRSTSRRSHMAASLGVASSAAHAARQAASVAPPRPDGLRLPGSERSLAPTAWLG